MNHNEKIRVLIVDDHVLFRSGIRSLLQRHRDFEVVDDVSDGLEGIKRSQILQPDIVLLDIHMPGISGREAVSAVLEAAPGTHVLMLTVSEDIDDLVGCLQAGASGYLLKNIGTNTLLDALQRVARGESIVSPDMTARLIDICRRPSQPAASSGRNDRLTEREREVLRELVAGETNKEIARKLCLAESTVKIHLQRIFKKLNLASRTKAALYAAEHGLDKQ